MNFSVGAFEHPIVQCLHNAKSNSSRTREERILIATMSKSDDLIFSRMLVDRKNHDMASEERSSPSLFSTFFVGYHSVPT